MTYNAGDRSRLRPGLLSSLSPLLIVALAAGCSGGGDPSAEGTAGVEASATPAPQMPAATIAPVGRAQLLAAAGATADEVAAGNAPPRANLELVGRTFELRLPFGCGGGMPADWGEWTFDPQTRVLRISVRPELKGEEQTIRAIANGLAYDAAEGFWLARPWTRSEDCPASPPSGTTPALPVEGEAPANAAIASPAASGGAAPTHTFAVVQYFSPDGPRTLRRGARPYSYTGKVPEGETVGAKGFRLKLTGRIGSYGDGQPIRCTVITPARPPVCAAAVEFSQVLLEDADTGKNLAEWNR